MNGTATTARTIKVTLDGDFTCEAVDHGERWNGFVVPHLTADAIDAWARWTGVEDGEWEGEQVEIADSHLTIWQDGEVISRVPAGDDGTYRFDLGLIWTEVA